MPIAAAIMGGSSIIGGIGSALIGSNAAQQASAQQVAAQQQALAKITAILQPIIGEGQGITQQGQGVLGSILPTLTGASQSIIGSTLPALQSLLTPGPNQTAALSQLPGFQFAQDWGQKAVQNMGTTMGLGGNTLTAGANYATGLAQQGFGNYVNQLQNFLGLGINTGQNVSNTGQNLINAGLTTQTNAGSALSSGSQSAISSIGNAQAAGTLGSANAISGGLTGALGGASNAALLYGLSNKFGGGGGGIYGNAGAYDPSGNLSSSDLSSAAQAGSASGLFANPFTGTVD
jgi:hypothetical protein